MDEAEFSRIAAEEWARIPERYAKRVDNLAVLVEDEPDDEVRTQEQLGPDDTLLGIYRGIPATERGSEYGVGMTLPDTITLYRLPLLEEAEILEADGALPEQASGDDYVRLAIRETIWHELGHYLGLSESEIHGREDEGSNRFDAH